LSAEGAHYLCTGFLAAWSLSGKLSHESIRKFKRKWTSGRGRRKLERNEDVLR
jgi:hypothetical protein